MRVSECPGLTRVQERKIKIAVEGTCELCSGYFALPLLENPPDLPAPVPGDGA